MTVSLAIAAAQNTGGAGSDVVYGGTGEDTLWGDAGADRFWFLNLDESTASAQDVVSDFVIGSDKINLTGLANEGIHHFSALTVSNDGTSTFFSVDGQDFTVKVEGLIALTATDFIFA